LNWRKGILDWRPRGGFWIENQENIPMNVFSSKCLSDNPKSKSGPADHNPKWGRIVAIVVTLMFCGAVVQAQQPQKVFRIGYLSTTDRATDSPRATAIRRALHELGYIEGKNFIFEFWYAAGKNDRQPELAAELVRLNVDLIVVAGGDPLIRAAKNATKTIPIVMTGSGSDPVTAGFVESLARPGGNVTGLTSLTTELGGKRLELLKEAVPKLARVAVLNDPTTPGATREVKEDLPVAARALGLSMRAWEVRTAEDFDRTFAQVKQDRRDGLYVLVAGGLLRSNVRRITDFALKSRLPSVYNTREVVDVGGLMSYGANPVERDRRVAYFVDRILKGAKPADLPVERPMKFDFVINLKTAKQIGLTIPPEVLARANRLIK
jgi:putative ABC transport system substrate-binding protein